MARLGTDRLARHVLEDFKETGVKTEFVYRASTGVTPVVVVRLAKRKDGTVQPRFEWKDPQSGDWLPRYRPFPKTKATEVAPQLPNAGVFYFDRAEKSALVMAEEMRDRGAVVFFEPSSCKDDALFTQCLAVSDVIKYSSDRISNPPKNPVSRSPRLEIQTLGSSGLRYRLKMGTDQPGAWQNLPAFTVDSLVDTTGCGDWCSAGIINELCRSGRLHFLKKNEAEIERGLRYGLALAAVNCQYQGARGPMYHISRNEFSIRVNSFLHRANLSSVESRVG